MKLSRADREIESLVREIRDGGLDLQPDFQRGEVWRVYKQQLLIDSILRLWYIPSIHVIEHEETHLQEILDGQQRLRAIMNFVDDMFPVAGDSQPLDANIMKLGDKYFSQLPDATRRAFLRFTITQYTITGFEPAEPAELFFRLNQNMPLTPAETRNAFVGQTREQIKLLVSEMIDLGLDRETIGFSNARMSYDDVLARLCIALEWGTIGRKITSKDLGERYRLGTPFAPSVIETTSRAMRLLAASRASWTQKVRFNKATLFSWLWFSIDLSATLPSLAEPARIGRLLSRFEAVRKGSRLESDASHVAELFSIVAIFQDRATSRVADVASVMLRDVALWLFAIRSDSTFRQGYEKLPREHPIVRRLAIGLMDSRDAVLSEGHIDALSATYSA
jgi:hypothetical protein